VNGNVTVAAGVTLTVQPGVVVKFNGSTRYLQVNGTVSAVGTAASPVVFTSIQDDSIGGDSGGDGPTVGAPGQWYDIRIASGNSASLFRYVIARFGGWGAAATGYGALNVSGAGTVVTVEQATITDNQRSGIRVSQGRALVSASTVARNQNGISVVDGSLALSGRSLVRENSRDGVWFSLSNGYAGPASTLLDSDVAANGEDGVDLVVAAGVPSASFPRGSRNNLFGNASGKQLYYPYVKRPEVDWTGNYFGSDVYFWYSAGVCGDTLPYSPGHLAYRWSNPPPGGGGIPTPPEGPIPHSNYLAGSGSDVALCPEDKFRIGPGEFSPFYLGGAFGVSPDQALGACGGLDAANHARPWTTRSTAAAATSSTRRLTCGCPVSGCRSRSRVSTTRSTFGRVRWGGAGRTATRPR
jgi:hypothetical protein